MKRVSIIVVMWLATGAIAGLPRPNSLDFIGLNKFLVQKVDDESPEANIATVKEDVASLSGSMKEAAEVSINLAEATECNDNVLSDLVKVTEAGLSLKGHKRIETVLKPYLIKATEACTEYLDQEVEFKVNDKFSDHVNRAPLLSIDTVEYLTPLYQKNRPHTGLFNAEFLNKLVWTLAKADPEAKIDKEIDETTGLVCQQVHKDNTARAFDEQLIQPCQQYTSTYKHLFEGAEATANLVGIATYLESRSNEFRAKAFTYGLCRTVQRHPEELRRVAVNYSASRISEVRNRCSEAAHRRARAQWQPLPRAIAAR